MCVPDRSVCVPWRTTISVSMTLCTLSNARRKNRSMKARLATESSPSNSTNGKRSSRLPSQSAQTIRCAYTPRSNSMLRLQISSRIFLLTVFAACIMMAASCHGLPKMTEEVVPEVRNPHWLYVRLYVPVLICSACRRLRQCCSNTPPHSPRCLRLLSFLP